MKTGPFPKTPIDRVDEAALGNVKTFKGARSITTQWLTKQRPVKQTYEMPKPGRYKGTCEAQ